MHSFRIPQLHRHCIHRSIVVVCCRESQASSRFWGNESTTSPLFHLLLLECENVIKQLFISRIRTIHSTRTRLYKQYMPFSTHCPLAFVCRWNIAVGLIVNWKKINQKQDRIANESTINIHVGGCCVDVFHINWRWKYSPRQHHIAHSNEIHHIWGGAKIWRSSDAV